MSRSAHSTAFETWNPFRGRVLATPASDVLVSLLKWTARTAAAVWVTAIFFHAPGVAGYERAELHELVHGESWRPFVTRALFPALVRVTSAAVPASAASALEQNPLVSSLFSYLQWPPRFIREYLMAFLLSAVCVVMLALTMEAIWKALFRPSSPQASLYGILGVLGLPITFQYYSYIYDFPSLLLYAACLLTMARRRWGWYFVLFGLACLSKETAVLLIAVFALYFIRRASAEPRTYWRFIGLQAVIFLAARGGLVWVFRDNPGSTVEWHFMDHNLRLLTTPWSIEQLVAWGVVAGLFAFQFGRKPWLLRASAGMIVPLMLLALLFGYLDELRDYYEVYVPVTALIAYSVSTLLGYPVDTIAATNPHDVPPILTRGSLNVAG